MVDRTQDKQKAATTVEFILIIPFMLILIFSSLEFSFMMVERHLLNSALYSSAKTVTRYMQNISLGGNTDSGFIVLQKDDEFYKVTVKPEDNGNVVKYDFGSLEIPAAPPPPTDGDSPIPSGGPDVEPEDPGIHEERENDNEGTTAAARGDSAVRERQNSSACQDSHGETGQECTPDESQAYNQALGDLNMAKKTGKDIAAKQAAFNRVKKCQSKNQAACQEQKEKCKFALAMYGGVLETSEFNRYVRASSGAVEVTNLSGLYNALHAKLSLSSCANTDTAVQRDIDSKKQHMDQSLLALNQAKSTRDAKVQRANQLEAAVNQASDEDRAEAQRQAQSARSEADQSESDVEAAQRDYDHKQSTYNNAKTNFNRYKYLPSIKTYLEDQGFTYTQSYPNESSYCQKPLESVEKLYNCAK